MSKPATYNDLFIGSVFVVRRRGDRGKYVKACPAYAVDEQGKDAIFDPDTPVRLIGRAKVCVLDYS